MAETELDKYDRFKAEGWPVEELVDDLAAALRRVEALADEIARDEIYMSQQMVRRGEFYTALRKALGREA